MELNPTVYRRAAKLVRESGQSYARSPFTCDTIQRVCSVTYQFPYFRTLDKYLAYYKEYFEPKMHRGFWWRNHHNQRSQHARIFALLLMAEIAGEEK